MVWTLSSILDTQSDYSKFSSSNIYKVTRGDVVVVANVRGPARARGRVCHHQRLCCHLVIARPHRR